ncbi:MAG TPA: septal ring lytic transglycosylase RlpA family protein, partial [Thermoanaerobaculia bacterium]
MRAETLTVLGRPRRPGFSLFSIFSVIGAVLALTAGGCATSSPAPSRPSSPPAASSSRPPAGGTGQLGEPVWIETGVASWYGGNDGFEGKPTASGEIYDSSRLTAAHRQLPLGTIVDVQNVENSRTVRVRINDRGPFVKGRVIDLSKAAAREIGVLGPGTASVRIALITRAADREPVAPPGGWAVQVGSFGETERAQRH